MTVTALVFLAATAVCAWALTKLVAVARIDGEMAERLRQLREDIERERRQAEVMTENRTPDDAVDRLDDGSF